MRNVFRGGITLLPLLEGEVGFSSSSPPASNERKAGCIAGFDYLVAGKITRNTETVRTLRRKIILPIKPRRRRARGNALIKSRRRACEK